MTFFFLFGVGLIAAFILGLWIRKRLHSAQLREKKSFDNFSTLPFIGIGVLSPELDAWLELNNTLCEMLGYSREELKQKSWSDINVVQEGESEIIKMDSLLYGKGNAVSGEKHLLCKDGSQILVRMFIRCIRTESNVPDYLIVFLERMTEYKVEKEKIHHLHRTYSLLSHCCHAVVHCVNQEELFEQICSILVLYADMKVAWVGLINQTDEQILPVAAQSKLPDFIEQVRELQKLTLLEPANKAIQEKHPIWIQDIAHDQNIEGWRDWLLQFDLQSTASLLLHKDEIAVGTINIYSAKLHTFNGELRHQLVEMIKVVDFALSHFQAESIHEKVENELVESEFRFRKLYADHIEAQEEIDYLNRFYSALSHCNQSVFRSTNDKELFDALCENMVRYGWMKTVWIGVVNKETKQVIPVASFGANQEDLKNLYVTIKDDEPTGQGPIGSAIREDKAFWFQDFLNDPRMQFWRDEVIRYGWRSGAALPIHKNGETIGGIVLYASEQNAFDEASKKLMIEMVSNIDFALDNLEREEQQQLSSQIFAQSNEGIMLLNADNKIVMVNNAFTVITGYAKEEVIGKNPRILTSGRQDEEFFKALWGDILHKGRWQGEMSNRRKNGEVYIQATSVQTMHNPEGKLTHYICVFSDITEHKEAEEQAYWFANFDALTGLPNRTLLRDRCDLAIKIVQRTNEPLTLMFVNLDHFKNVNDSLGHNIGDEILKQFSERMTAVLNKDDVVSRHAADSFTLVMPGINDDRATYRAEQLLRIAAEAYVIEGHEINLTASIGIAMYPTDGTDFDTLARSADAAMHRAKENDQNTYRFFTAEMQANSTRLLQLDSALRRAQERNQFSVYYQPKMSLENDRIVGFEALIRWSHPVLGTLSPAEFIPLAESNGQIIPIGEWILNTALQQLRSWIDKGFEPVVMSVNLSGAQFRDPRLSELIMSALANSGLPPEYLEMELTEGVAMKDPHAAVAVIDNLHKQGIRVSIDDFGTGYSSLAYLKRFSLYKLKIDQSFIRDIPNNPEDMEIVKAVISLANSLKMRTVAEGVNNAEQVAFLRDNGCDEIQGYYLSKPISAEAAEVFLQQHNMQKSARAIHA